MKKHLVLVTGDYFPNPSPTAKCAQAYVNLLKDRFDVEVVCLSEDRKTPYYYEDEKVNPTGSKYYYLQKWAGKKLKNPIVNIAFRIPPKLIRPFIHPNIHKGFVNVAWQKLEEIHKKNPIDVVFSACAPVAAHAAAFKFKENHKEVHWTAYTVDSYAAQQLSKRRRASAMKFERKMFAGADKILVSEEIYDSMKNLYEGFEDKCFPLPYLMPERSYAESDKFFLAEGKVNLVYVGRFYKKLRQPEFLLKTALGLGDKYVLNLYAGDVCSDVVREFAKKSGGSIVSRPWASPEDIECIYNQADILVNVGNSVPEFKPSKIFEYISTGKPIINFYYPGFYDEELAKNPLVLHIEMSGDASLQVEKVRNFIDEVCGKRLTESEVDEIYSSHSKENIKNILCGCVE